MEVDLVAESIKFMILGMLIVLIFLMVLVEIMKLQARLINKYFPQKAPTAPTPNISQDEESKRVAAIIAAVAEFRKNQNK
ncbi:MAG: Na+-transporting oxaloacetate decarboxylase subunit gamma [Sulfurovum sp. PC08-66]|jgi:oxaloacetate decarboxylase gamma subunit|nr:MAG: Na+-transporting oxaloacetate decarboxylase subunit gamma [Sulfurovum sp. PC08-66]